MEGTKSTPEEFFPATGEDQRLRVTSGSDPIVEAAFEKVLQTLTDLGDPGLQDVAAWIRRVVEYNVPEGKRNRLVFVMLAYQLLSDREAPTVAKVNGQNGHSHEAVSAIEQAAILGWCVELLQAYFLICDDIMDKSVTRRGKSCWYRVEGVQMMAINDAILCETAIYRILRKFFRQHPNYVDLVELFQEVSHQTSAGQCLDMLSERQGADSYLQERYEAIVLYKTAYYSFSLPIRLGMYLAGISDEVEHKKAEKLSLQIGHIFQVQDDFLDCYGDPAVIGKVGTDIADAKCSWLIVKALEIASSDQKRILLENYGRGQPGGSEEATVKEIYDALNMQKVFRDFEDKAFTEIKEKVEELCRNKAGDGSVALTGDIFKLLSNRIYRRNK